MKKRVKIIAGAVFLGVLAVAGLVVLLMPVRVETETVQKADLLDTFTVSATVTPKDSQYVCAPLSGTVSEVAAKEGETVEQGAKIVVLDDSQTRDELNRQIESLKAQKTSAQSEGTSTKAQLSVSRQQLESQLKQAHVPAQHSSVPAADRFPASHRHTVPGAYRPICPPRSHFGAAHCLP